MVEEITGDEAWYLLQSQVLSLTDVPELYQRIVGVNGAPGVCGGLGEGESVQAGTTMLLLDARHAYGAPLEELVQTSCPLPPDTAAAAPPAACTRHWVGDAPAIQPAYTSPGRPSKRFCRFCATQGPLSKELFAGCTEAVAYMAGAPEACGGFVCQASSETESPEAQTPGNVKLVTGAARDVALAQLQRAFHAQQTALARAEAQAAASAVAASGGTQALQAIAGRLAGAAKHVRKYEAIPAQEAALAAMPLVRLAEEACERVQELRTTDMTPGEEGSAYPLLEGDAGQQDNAAPGHLLWRDCLLKVLTSWFKNEFFQWVNNPSCDACGSDATQGVGAAQPTPAEASGGAGRVEVYACSACGAHTRFPRYNDPVKLLSWRKGRCGEWSNAFALLCTALGFDTRHVHDWTDHVWVEVWSPAQVKWLHVDPCENAVDAPLTYESGWGKKLNWIIAISPRHIVDVTWRYTTDWAGVSSRRRAVPEAWLAPYIAAASRTQWEAAHLAVPNFGSDGSAAALGDALVSPSSAPPALLAWMQSRAAYAHRQAQLEAMQLWTTVSIKGGQASAEELRGRQSGSLTWRAVRGELGIQAAAAGAGAGGGGAVSEDIDIGVLHWHTLPLRLSLGKSASASASTSASGGDETPLVELSCISSWGAITAGLAQARPLVSGPACPHRQVLVWRRHASLHAQAAEAGDEVPDTGLQALASAGWRVQHACLMTSTAGTALRGSVAMTAEHFPLPSAPPIVSLVAIRGTSSLIAVGAGASVFLLGPPTDAHSSALQGVSIPASPWTGKQPPSFFVAAQLGQAPVVEARFAAIVDDVLVVGGTGTDGQQAVFSMDPAIPQVLDRNWLQGAITPKWATSSFPPPPCGLKAMVQVPGRGGAVFGVSRTAGLLGLAHAPPLKPLEPNAEIAAALGKPIDSITKPVMLVGEGRAGCLRVTVGLPCVQAASRGPSRQPRRAPPTVTALSWNHLLCIRRLGEPIHATAVRGSGCMVRTREARAAGTSWVALAEVFQGTQHEDEPLDAPVDVDGLPVAAAPLARQLLPPIVRVHRQPALSPDRLAPPDALVQRAEFRSRLAGKLATAGGAANPGRLLLRAAVPMDRILPGPGVLEVCLVKVSPRSVTGAPAADAWQVMCTSQPFVWAGDKPVEATQPTWLPIGPVLPLPAEKAVTCTSAGSDGAGNALALVGSAGESLLQVALPSRLVESLQGPGPSP